MRLRFVALFLVLGWIASPALAQKQALDHADYDRWKEIDDEAISDDGRWALFTAHPPEGDGALRVKGLAADAAYDVPRGENPQFTADSRYAAFLIAPPFDSTRQAKLDEVPPPNRPKDALGLLDLDSGEVTEIDRVQSFKLPEEGSGWIAYHRELPLPDSTEDAKSENEDEGAPLVLRRLADGQAWTYAHATSYAFAENGQLFAFTTADSAGAAIHAVRFEGDAPQVTRVHEGADAYPQMAMNAAGTQLAFLAGPDSTDAPHHDNTLYRWTPGDEAPTALVQSGTAGVPSGWLVSEQAELAFSASGARLFFGTAPQPPAPVEQDSLLEEEVVGVDVWHWQDPYLQPMQKEQAEAKKEQTYQAAYFVEEGRVLQLATEAVPAVTVGNEGDADWALGVTNRPYRQAMSWDWPPAVDAHLIDVQTGARKKVLENVQAIPQLSPEARYVVWWDRDERAWNGLRTEAPAQHVTLSSAIPHPVHNQEHDVPYPAGPYGLAGWTAGDTHVLIYDAHDLWAVDPMAPDAARSITEETGRANSLELRYLGLDRDRDPAAWGRWPNAVNPPTVVPDGPLLLSAFHTETKAAGFYRDRVSGTQAPARLLLQDRAFSTPRKADDADRLLYTRESYQEFPDLWVASLDFSDPKKISTVNPQQRDYRWGTVERVEWTSVNGDPLEGLLYKPEGFDPSQQYPMMTYFYEQYSDRLHRHHAPAAGRSVINFTFYTSRGYLVFVPDIHYEEGYPGESAMQSVMPGVTKLIDRGYVDPENIGVQGHSWGGYQIAYMVTKTNLFKAAEAGAPVSNMTSAYGGIRWGSGMSRMFQYEETQSRIGGTLWEMPLRYLDNSPLFQADRIETPLLMMHNDQDTAVPWEQGIELFVALRRLGKPAWLINYNDAPHWPVTLAEKRDWTRRMQQFFDHYLKGAPAPPWLKEGVPAVEKGRTLGLEPLPTDAGQ